MTYREANPGCISCLQGGTKERRDGREGGWSGMADWFFTIYHPNMYNQEVEDS
jgi:hypothetical protein